MADDSKPPPKPLNPFDPPGLGEFEFIQKREPKKPPPSGPV
jgi:hypothetical protein